MSLGGHVHSEERQGSNSVMRDKGFPSTAELEFVNKGCLLLVFGFWFCLILVRTTLCVVLLEVLLYGCELF